MRKINILYSLFIILLLPACYEDLGSYDYHAINTLEVDSILPSYNIDRYDSLCIHPVLRGTQYSDTNRFTYQWEIGTQTVGTAHDLNLYVELSEGFKFARYVVTDKETGVKKYHTFNVEVKSSTAADLIMILSKYQGRAELSYIRLDKEADWEINCFKERYGENLGTNPQQPVVCYTERMSANYPFTNYYGRIMTLSDNQIRLLDKNTLEPDTITPYLTGAHYTQFMLPYPTPDISIYQPEWIDETIGATRMQTAYNSLYNNNYFMQIGGGRLYTMNHYTLGASRANANLKSPYENGNLSSFGYWDDMSNLESYGTNMYLGCNVGDFILFDKANHRFCYNRGSSSIYSILETDVKAFPQYNNLLWGSATVITNNTSLAILNNGDNCRMVILQNGKGGKNGTTDTKKLVKDIDCSGIMSAQSKFYMMKFNEYLFFTKGDKLYRYNLLDAINSGTAPSNTPIFSLSELGYGPEAKITSLFVSRSEQTLLLGVSRYGNDAEASGEEPKGDVLWFDLNASNVSVTYNEKKSAKGVAGIPVDIKIKFQTLWRDGLNYQDVLVDQY